MIFKNFKVNVVLRVLLICLLIALLMYYLIIAEKYLRSVYIGLFLLLAIWELLWYIDKSNRDFGTFLLALLQDDFSTKFSADYKGKSFSLLYKAYNQITQKFKAINNDKELQHQYLLSLIAHINIGIISFDEGGNVHLINNAFKEFIDKPFINHIDAIKNVDQQLFTLISEISAGQNRLFKINQGNQLSELVFEASEFKLFDIRYKLVSVKNITNELDQNETQSWQKLIRVLTHEIMNSITPITSLSETLHRIAKQNLETQTVPDQHKLKKIEEGLMVIHHRSQGLLGFTDAYKKLTRIPSPNFSQVAIKDLLNHVKILLKSNLALANVMLTYHINDENLKVKADEELLSQVLINLIKNAIEALKNKPDGEINISVNKHRENHTMIKIADNGPGIDKDALDKIFIPFYTTKEEGSGIGLSLSKQIIALHKGILTVQSKEGIGCTFIIIL